jgi:hypothetical protein
MDTGLKLLSPHYPALQVAALRALSSLPLVIAFVAWRGAFGSLLNIRWPLHLLRGVLGIGMLSLFSFALRHLPLAEAYSIFFVAPLLITLLSVRCSASASARRAGSRSRRPARRGGGAAPDRHRHVHARRRRGAARGGLLFGSRRSRCASSTAPTRSKARCSG